MTHIDTGVYGAKVQSWAAKNPRDILKRFMDENPTAGKLDVFNLFRDEIKSEDTEEYLDVVIEYWFANNYYSLVPTADPSRQVATRDSIKEAAQEKAVTKAIATQIDEKAKIKLLEMMMPNGKPFGDCTGGECSALAPKVGGLLAVVATKVKADEKVRDVMSEDQLRELYECSRP